ncbi:2',5'-phosphodiesterase 12 [Armadillidium vulgare]|nr:2',5'-phosphodiesterase 12 [Armadillidium vulgare]
MDDHTANNYPKIVVIHNKETNDICINFRYINEDLNFDRYFNFQRKDSEKCARIFSRISDNITKILRKKIRKSQKGSKDVEIPESINISVISKKDKELQDVDKNSCLDVFVSKANNYFLRIENTYYVFDVNPPLITTLELPKKNIMAGFLVYPSKLEGLNYNLSDTKLKWFTSKEKFQSYDEAKSTLEKLDWEEFAEGFHVFTLNKDVSKLLKVVCSPFSGSRKGSDLETVFGDLISPGPGLCPFQKRHLINYYFPGSQ